MYIFKCYLCHKNINLWEGDAYRTEIVRINGHWVEVQVHLNPVCGKKENPFHLIQGGRNELD